MQKLPPLSEAICTHSKQICENIQHIQDNNGLITEFGKSVYETPDEQLNQDGLLLKMCTLDVIVDAHITAGRNQDYNFLFGPKDDLIQIILFAVSEKRIADQTATKIALICAYETAKSTLARIYDSDEIFWVAQYNSYITIINTLFHLNDIKVDIGLANASSIKAIDLFKSIGEKRATAYALVNRADLIDTFSDFSRSKKENYFEQTDCLKLAIDIFISIDLDEKALTCSRKLASRMQERFETHGDIIITEIKECLDRALPFIKSKSPLFDRVAILNITASNMMSLRSIGLNQDIDQPISIYKYIINDLLHNDSYSIIYAQVCGNLASALFEQYKFTYFDDSIKLEAINFYDLTIKIFDKYQDAPNLARATRKKLEFLAYLIDEEGLSRAIDAREVADKALQNKIIRRNTFELAKIYDIAGIVSSKLYKLKYNIRPNDVLHYHYTACELISNFDSPLAQSQILLNRLSACFDFQKYNIDENIDALWSDLEFIISVFDFEQYPIQNITIRRNKILFLEYRSEWDSLLNEAESLIDDSASYLKFITDRSVRREILLKIRHVGALAANAALGLHDITRGVEILEKSKCFGADFRRHSDEESVAHERRRSASQPNDALSQTYQNTDVRKFSRSDFEIYASQQEFKRPTIFVILWGAIQNGGFFIYEPISKSWSVHQCSGYREENILPLYDFWSKSIASFRSSQKSYADSKRIFFKSIETLQEKLRELVVDSVKRAIYHRLKLKNPCDINLVFFPPGELSCLPLSAAFNFSSENSKSGLFNIAVFPSLQSYLSTLRSHSSTTTRNLLGVTNPEGDLGTNIVSPASYAFEKDSFIDLTSTLSARSKSYFATIQNIRLHLGKMKPSFFCYYGHARWQPFDVRRSAIYVLTDKSAESGKRFLRTSERYGKYSLNVEEIREMDFKDVALVVLAGCETSLIDTAEAPNEFEGLPLAFIEAGASAVICTLWKVDHISTFIIVREIMINIINHNQDVSSALCSAQLAYIQNDRRYFAELGAEYDDSVPARYHAAAFTLIGG